MTEQELSRLAAKHPGRVSFTSADAVHSWLRTTLAVAVCIILAGLALLGAYELARHHRLAGYVSAALVWPLGAAGRKWPACLFL